VIRKNLAIAFVLSLIASAATAQTCGTIPNNLTNGTTANASQVMANFNFLVGCVGALRGYIGGLTMSNDGSNPNQVIDTSPGIAESDSVTTMMTLGAFTKNANLGWTVGTGGGCADGAGGYTTLGISVWYHLFVIARTDTGAVDELCSLSPTSPTLPTGYTKQRRIGSFKTDGSAHILAFSQNGDEFLWAAPTVDANYAGTLGTTPVTPTLTVPPGVKVNALLSGYFFNASETLCLLNSLDQPAVVPGANLTVINDLGNNGQSYVVNVRTTNQQIRAVATLAGSTLAISTYGWIDSRGRFN